jgi:hypothetical protein
MVKRSLLPLAALGTLLAWSPLSTASGTIGGAGGIQAPQRVVDERYEYGKSVYLGREPGVAKISYCLQSEDKPRKLRRRALKPFRGGPAGEFASALVNCDAPEQRALTGLKPEQARLVLYYLNKRYKLKLTNG